VDTVGYSWMQLHTVGYSCIRYTSYFAQNISRALKSGGTDMSGVRSTNIVDEECHKTLIYTDEQEKILERS
jgi:hypothetical protein